MVEIPHHAFDFLPRHGLNAAGASGSLPITDDQLRNSPSGDLFGLSQNAGMGWNPAEVGRRQFLILSTQGGLRAPDGRPVALHTFLPPYLSLAEAYQRKLNGGTCS